MEKQRISEDNLYENIDNITNFPVRIGIGMLDNAKARWEENAYSSKELVTEARRDL